MGAAPEPGAPTEPWNVRAERPDRITGLTSTQTVSAPPAAGELSVSAGRTLAPAANRKPREERGANGESDKS